MTDIPKDIDQFIKLLECQLANLPPHERQQMMQIIKDLVKFAQDKPINSPDQTKH